MKTGLFYYLIVTIFTMVVTCGKGGVPGAQGSSVGGKSNSSGRRTMVAPSIEGRVLHPVSLDRSLTVSGTLLPFEETVLMPEVSGRVVAVRLPEGKPVKKGTLLVKLFDGDLQAQLRKAQAQLAIAKQTQARLSELLTINGVSRSEYDNAVLNVNSLGADVELISMQIQKTEVRAPFNGVLGLKQISVGAQITPSTPLVTIRMVDRMKVDFSVSEKYSSEIAPGMRLSFSVEGSTARHTATVMAIEGGIEVTTRNLRVRAVVDEVAAELKPGAFAKVMLSFGEGRGALMVPTHAIIPEERDKKVIRAKAGRAQFITVQTGVRRDTVIEVTDGLAAGDTIVTTGLLFIKPGAELKFSRVVH